MHNHIFGRMIARLGWPTACATAAALAAGAAYLLLPTTGGETSVVRAGDDIPLVRTETPGVRMVNANILGVAKILPREEISIVPEQAGWLRSLDVEPGQRLKAGKLIGSVQMLRNPSEDATRSYALAMQQAKLTADEYEAAARVLANAKAEKSAAESRVILAEKQLAAIDIAVDQGVAELAEAEQAVRASRALVEAKRDLYQRGLIARNKVEEAESAKSDAEAGVRLRKSNLSEMRQTSAELASAVEQGELAVQEAAQSVRRAEAQAETLRAVAQRHAVRARRQRDRIAVLAAGPLMPIRASVDGVVLKVAAKPGTLVTPAGALVILKRAGVAPAILLSESPLTGGIKAGTPVVVSAKSGKQFTGKIVQAAPAANGGFQALLRIPDPDQVMLPGEAVSALIRSAKRKMMTVSSSALEAKENKNFVWILENGSATRREVKVAGTVQDEVLIESGLADTDAVIFEASRDLVDGGVARLME